MTAKTLPRSEKLISIFSKFPLIPFTLQDNVIRYQSLPRRVYWYIGSLAVSCLQAIYTVSQMTQFLMPPQDPENPTSMNVKDFVQAFMNAVVAVIYMIFHCNTYKHMDDYCALYNQLVIYRNRKADLRIINLRDFKIQKTLLAFSLFRYGAYAGKVLSHPERKIYWSSLTPKKHWSAPWMIFYTWFTLQWVLSVIAMLNITLILLFVYVETVNVVIEHRIKVAQDENMGILEYRQLQLLNKLYNCCFSTVLYPSVVVSLMLVGVVGWYASVRFFGQVPLKDYVHLGPLAFMAIYFCLKLFPTAAKEYEFSVEEKRIRVFNYSKNVHKWKEGKIILNSCPPLQIKLCEYFGVTRTTGISIVSLIIVQSVSMLIYF